MQHNYVVLFTADWSVYSKIMLYFLLWIKIRKKQDRKGENEEFIYN